MTPRRQLRHGFTIVELMLAIAISSTVAAIGFIGIQGFSRAITRAKQFTAETQLITAALTYTIRDADGQTLLSSAAFATLPQGWPVLTVTPVTTVIPTVTSGLRLSFQPGTNRADFIGRTNTPTTNHDVYIVTMPKR